MPVSAYDSLFGGKKGSAAEALASMKRQYGDAKGTSIFYASVAKRKKKG